MKRDEALAYFRDRGWTGEKPVACPAGHNLRPPEDRRDIAYAFGEDYALADHVNNENVHKVTGYLFLRGGVLWSEEKKDMPTAAQAMLLTMFGGIPFFRAPEKIGNGKAKQNDHHKKVAKRLAQAERCKAAQCKTF